MKQRILILIIMISSITTNITASNEIDDPTLHKIKQNEPDYDPVRELTKMVPQKLKDQREVYLEEMKKLTDLAEAVVTRQQEKIEEQRKELAAQKAQHEKMIEEHAARLQEERAQRLTLEAKLAELTKALPTQKPEQRLQLSRQQSALENLANMEQQNKELNVAQIEQANKALAMQRAINLAPKPPKTQFQKAGEHLSNFSNFVSRKFNAFTQTMRQWHAKLFKSPEIKEIENGHEMPEKHLE